MARVWSWNGRNVPLELRDLPAGQYVIEAVSAPALSAEEEEQLLAGIRSIDAGRTVSWAKARAKIDKQILAASPKRPPTKRRA